MADVTRQLDMGGHAGRLSPPLLGTFFAFSAALCALAAWSLFDPLGPAAAIWTWKPLQFRELLSVRPFASAGFVILAMVMAVTSAGCFAAKRWGWRLAVGLIGINAGADGGRALGGELLEGLIGFALASVVIWGLFRPSVRSALRK